MIREGLARVAARTSRWFRRKPLPTGRTERRRANSCWSIRSTGRAEFLAGRLEYTVNIALVRDGTPVVGVVAAPALGPDLARGDGSRRRTAALCRRRSKRAAAASIRTRPWPADERVAAVSRSHFDPASAAFLERLAPVGDDRLRLGASSSAASPKARPTSIPRLAPTSEWDVAAGHALVAAAGGVRRCAPDGGQLALRRSARGISRPGLHRLGRCRGRAAISARTLYSASSLLTVGPARRGRRDHRCGIGQEGRPRVGRIEEIEPLLVHDPQRREIPASRGRARCRPDRSRRSAAYRHPGRPRTPRDCPHCGSARSRPRGGIRTPARPATGLPSVK